MIEFHVTYASKDEAAEIAREAVEMRLAACVNLLGEVRSIYRWENAVEDESEILAVFKTSQEKAGELADFLEVSHPYDTPAIIRHGNVSANADYARWIEEETKIA
ncbi:MAG: divalent-cation tolerance protein CutA [Nitratireductor sp.]|nr:divalent-cation tolerance protein CutA [Nitratireductor sp.]